MRRFCALLLRVFLPLQYSWAAVAVYCDYETPAQAQHLGHHEHAHHGAADLGSHAPGDESPAAGAADCGHCHGGCASLLPRFATVTASIATNHPRPSVDDTGSAQTPPRPERPQWLPLA